MPENHSNSHHSGFGAGIVLGLLGGLFAYFLYDTPEGQDLRHRFKTELDQVKSNLPQPSQATNPLVSPTPTPTPSSKPNRIIDRFTQLFTQTSESTKDRHKPKKIKKQSPRRYFIRKKSN